MEKEKIIKEIKRLCRVFILLIAAPLVAFIAMGKYVWITEFAVPMPQPVQKQIRQLEVEDIFNRHKLRAYRAHNGSVSFEKEPRPYGRTISYRAVFTDTYKRLRVSMNNDATYYIKSDGSYEVASSYKNVNACMDKLIVSMGNGITVYTESKINGSKSHEIILQGTPALSLIDTADTTGGYVSAYVDKAYMQTEEGLVKFDSDGNIQARYPLPPGFIMATESQAEELGMYTLNTVYRRVHPRTYIACMDKEGENIFYSCRRPTADGYKEFSFVYHTPTGWIGIPEEIIYATKNDYGLYLYQAFVINFKTAPETAHIPRPYKTALLIMDAGKPRFDMFLNGDFLPEDFNQTGVPYEGKVQRVSERNPLQSKVFTITDLDGRWQIVADFKNNSIVFHNK